MGAAAATASSWSSTWPPCARAGGAELFGKDDGAVGKLSRPTGDTVPGRDRRHAAGRPDALCGSSTAPSGDHPADQPAAERADHRRHNRDLRGLIQQGLFREDCSSG